MTTNMICIYYNIPVYYSMDNFGKVKKISIFGEKKLEKSFIFAEKIEFENSVFF